MLVMVAVGLAVSGHMNKLRLRVVFETCLEPGGEVLPGVQKSLEGNGARSGAVVEEDCDRGSGGETNQVGPRSIDRCAGSVGPVSSSSNFLEWAYAAALVRGEQGELDAVQGHQ